MLLLDASDMLVNISHIVPQLMQLATALSYVSGMWLMISSIASMSKATTFASPQQGQVSMGSLLRKLFVGAGLVYLPSVVDIGTVTLFSTTTPISYITQTSSKLAQFINDAFQIIYLIGVISYIKGLYELAYEGTFQSQDGNHHSRFKKGITHMIGGALCINIQLTLQMVFSSLGFTWFLF